MGKFKIVTIIPARGGSKSLPRKNISLLANKPLISYSIEYSLKCSLVSRTIVSTDDEEIAEISKKYGADVPFLRPKEISDDLSQDYGFMRHAMNYFDSENINYDLFVLMRPTSPLRPENLIEKAIEIFNQNSDCSSVRTVAPIKEHPYRCWEIQTNGTINPVIKSDKEIYNLPRQVLPNYFYQTGDLEVVNRSTLLSGSVSGKRVYPILLTHDQMIDIDTSSDQKKAENILRQN